jgi:hypothetical protein
MAENAAENRDRTFILMQQGGSSGEWYLHAHESLEEAEEDIKDRALVDYNCTSPMEMPENLAKALRAFPDAAEELYLLIEEIVTDCVMGNFAEVDEGELDDDDEEEEEEEEEDDEEDDAALCDYCGGPVTVMKVCDVCENDE